MLYRIEVQATNNIQEERISKLSIDFWFDFSSPYSYIANEQLALLVPIEPEIVVEQRCQLKY